MALLEFHSAFPASSASAPAPPGTPALRGLLAYQLSLPVCERCGRGAQRAGADSIEIEPARIDAARCDATIRNDAQATNDAHVGALDEPTRPLATGSPPGAPVARARRRTSIPPAMRRRVLERDHHRCQIPGCRHTLDLDESEPEASSRRDMVAFLCTSTASPTGGCRAAAGCEHYVLEARGASPSGGTTDQRGGPMRVGNTREGQVPKR